MRTRTTLQIIFGLLCCVYTLTLSQTVVSVPAVQMWTSTGISLAAGQTYKISTSGTWNGAPGYPFNATGALGGYPGMSTHPNMCLLGKIGSNVFYLGNGGSSSAPSTGTLYLGPNDGPTADCWADNSGSLSCNVNGTSVSVIANQAWTSTGVSFSSGQTMTISASGTWNGAPGYAFGPLGACGGYSGMSAYPNMCLLGKIGSNVFYLGSGGDFTAASSGTLYLGPNDGPTADCWGDNSGSLSITITTESVSTPTTPSGPSSGQSGQSLSFSTGGAACTQGHSVEYRFDWGDGYTSSWGSVSQSHSFSSPGNFVVKAQAKCTVNNSAVSAWSSGKSVTIATLQHAVSTPNIPTGPTNGQTGQSFSFSANGSSCNQGHNVEYRFDWGDGSISIWGTAAQNHILTNSGNFAIKAQARCSVDNSVVSSWSNSMTINISTPSNNLPWIFVNTGISHTIIIPLQASPNINNTVLTEGDYIGIFYDKDGTLTCGGYEKWIGVGNISVSAFGNDATTTDKDGFNEGEAFRWKVFRHSDGMLFDANVAYLAIGTMGGIISHTGSYSSGGISGLAVFNGGITTHSLNLRIGWNLISSFVDPQQPSLDEVFKSIKADVIIIKNGIQKVYIPSQGINSIGNWINIEGYQVKMNAAKTLELKGLKITPEVTNINLSTGWSILGYCRDKEISVSSALSKIVESIVILKDQDGKAFIPSAGINTINTLKSGQGYQIKMSNSASFQYPANSNALEKSIKEITFDFANPWSYTKTGTSHTIIIPLIVGNNLGGISLDAGDCIGVFYDSSQTRACAGLETWTGTSNFAIAAFGDDPTTTAKDGFADKDTIFWRIWRKRDGTMVSVNANYQPAGSMSGIVTHTNLYSANGISALSTLTVPTRVYQEEPFLPTNFLLEQNFPNPFNPTTCIRYNLPTECWIKMEIFNSTGQKISTIVNEEQSAGTHQMNWQPRNVSGIYFYRLEATPINEKTGKFIQIKKMLYAK